MELQSGQVCLGLGEMADSLEMVVVYHLPEATKMILGIEIKKLWNCFATESIRGWVVKK